jgi:anthranilate phosphoribosyltransferase
MNFEAYVDRIKQRKNLSRQEAETFLGLMVDDGELSDEQLADALTALTDKKVTVDEVCGFVDAMRIRMVHVPDAKAVIDTCGTGGDKAGTFNISTAAAILLAGGGVSVAKHGNRAATSKCGSADVLEALGIPVDLTPAAAAQALADYGFVFLFAPLYHPSLKRLTIVRRQLGFPTVFNLLGPLLNPAGVKRQVIGTFSAVNARLLADVMARMGSYEHAIVLTSDDGLDEASLDAPVSILEVKGASVTKTKITAADYGLEPAPISALQGGDAARNARLITEALQPADSLSAHQRIIVFNAGLGFYVAGATPTIEDGVKKATVVLTNGQGSAKLKELTART